MKRMIYVVGLGNPGKKYANTRHNIGWSALDTLAAEAGENSDPESVPHWQAKVLRVTVEELSVALVYPETFMNRSGETVRAILKDDPEASVILVHDEVALPLGQVKIVQGRGAGGHNGVQSVFDQTQRKDFPRVRVGVAPVHPVTGKTKMVDGATLRRHVLGSFGLWERSRATSACKAAAASIRTIVSVGVVTAMNQHN